MEGPEPNGVIAVFPTREGVDLAMRWLEMDEIDRRSISIFGPGVITDDLPPELDRTNKHSSEIARYWAKWGATLGALAGAGPVSIALAAASVGLGPMALVVAAGVAAMAATAGVGAMTGALVGVGVHEQSARRYEQALHDGKFVVVVHSDNPATLRSAVEEFRRLQAEHVDVHGLTGVPPPRAAPHEKA